MTARPGDCRTARKTADGGVRTIGYALIPLLLSVILAIRWALEEGASPAARLGVVIVVAASLGIWHFAPSW